MSSSIKAKSNGTIPEQGGYDSYEFEKRLITSLKNGVKYGMYPLLYEGASTIGTAYPIYKNLRLRQDQMKRDNIIGGDNYSHRLGMCDAGQLGMDGAIAALAGGVLKETRDIYCKTQGQCGEKKQSFGDAFNDSKKDMLNNLEGLYYGLRYPDRDCRVWLKDLDLKTNTWKNGDEEKF